MSHPAPGIREKTLWPGTVRTHSAGWQVDREDTMNTAAMNTAAICELAATHGPFASVYLPSDVGGPPWPVLRRALAVQQPARELLEALDDALSRGTTTEGRALIANQAGILMDGPLAWSPHTSIARLSDLPYLLPLVPKHAVRAPEAALVAAGRDRADTVDGQATAGRTLFDQFLFESARPGGPVVQGLRHCVTALRNHNADALVLTEGALADRIVWVGGTHRDQVAEEAAELRAVGMPSTSERADEALPMAALTIHAEVLVATADLPLTDGVGVLLRHP
jgi:hypothetical protein